MSNADELGTRHYWSEEDNARLAVSCNVTIVAVVMRHAKRLCLIILQSVAANLAAPYFSTLSHKRHDFKKRNFWKLNVFSFFLQLLSETSQILRRIQRDVNHNCTQVFM